MPPDDPPFQEPDPSFQEPATPFQEPDPPFQESDPLPPFQEPPPLLQPLQLIAIKPSARPKDRLEYITTSAAPMEQLVDHNKHAPKIGLNQ
jgi:hypothetical protein